MISLFRRMGALLTASLAFIGGMVGLMAYGHFMGHVDRAAIVLPLIFGLPLLGALFGAHLISHLRNSVTPEG